MVGHGRRVLRAATASTNREKLAPSFFQAPFSARASVRRATPGGGGGVSAHLEKMSLTHSKGTEEVAPRKLQTKAASGERGGGGLQVVRVQGRGGGGRDGGEPRAPFIAANDLFIKSDDG